MERPEGTINAILVGVRQMQQLSLDLAGRLAVTGPPGQGPQVERDHLGRMRSEARKYYLSFTRDRPTFERRQDWWSDFAIWF